MSSHPCALLQSNRIIWSTLTLSSMHLALNGGKLLPLSNSEHCFTNKSLKMSALCWKLVAKIPFSRRGSMLEVFFSIDYFIQSGPVSFNAIWRIRKLFSQILKVSFTCVCYHPTSCVPHLLNIFPMLRFASTLHILVENPMLAFHCCFDFTSYQGWISVVNFYDFMRNIAGGNFNENWCKYFNHFINM